MGQPRSISTIIDESSINQEEEMKIQKYAVGWAKRLNTNDAKELEQAHSKLSSPFDSDSHMTPYARSLYGKYLKEGFLPLLINENENEMGAVNALQILSLLGTEQACDVLLKHSDSITEHRPALRLWSSIGLGTSFLTGELQLNRVEWYAKLLSNFIGMEQDWFVLARQFDSLAALQLIPKLDRSQKEVLEKLSFELQTKSLTRLLSSIIDSGGGDSRVRSLPFIFPSLLLQLIEPSVDETTKSDTLDALLPPLIAFVESAATTGNSQDDPFLYGAYGGASQSAGLLIARSTGHESAVSIIELWNNENYPAILGLVESWKTKQ